EIPSRPKEEMRPMVSLTLISFGYGHEPPPACAVATFDLRRHFADPARVHGLVERTGDDADVRSLVQGTPGITSLISAIVAVAAGYALAPRELPVVIAIGCVGGRHRSVVVTDSVADYLSRDPVYDLTVVHRDVERPVINRPAVRSVNDG